MYFELAGAIRQIETIAAGPSVRVRDRLRRSYGGLRWRKLKGVARVRLPSDKIVTAELHWFECHGVGRREMKIKRLLP